MSSWVMTVTYEGMSLIFSPYRVAVTTTSSTDCVSPAQACEQKHGNRMASQNPYLPNNNLFNVSIRLLFPRRVMIYGIRGLLTQGALFLRRNILVACLPGSLASGLQAFVPFTVAGQRKISTSLPPVYHYVAKGNATFFLRSSALSPGICPRTRLYSLQHGPALS